MYEPWLSTVLAGIAVFGTLGGTLGGVYLGHRLQASQRREERRFEYNREALTRINSFAGDMELAAQTAVLWLGQVNVHQSRQTKSAIVHNLRRIFKRLSQEPIMPTLLDEQLVDKWRATSQKFTVLYTTMTIEMPNLPRQSTRPISMPEMSQMILQALQTDDDEQLHSLLATNEHGRAILGATLDLLKSVIDLRAEVQRVAING